MDRLREIWLGLTDGAGCAARFERREWGRRTLASSAGLIRSNRVLRSKQPELALPKSRWLRMPVEYGLARHNASRRAVSCRDGS